jgi:hypothetical protein
MVYKVQAYKSLSMTEPKRGTQDSPSSNPLSMATRGIREVESKEQQTPNKPKAQSTSY